MANGNGKLVYALYDAWLSEAQVRENFEHLRGRQPAEAKRTGGGWLVGPLTRKELQARKDGTEGRRRVIDRR